MADRDQPPYVKQIFDLFSSSFPQSLNFMGLGTEITARRFAGIVCKLDTICKISELYGRIHRKGVKAVIEYAVQKPEAIDFMVTVFERAVQLFPETIKPTHDTVRTDLQHQLTQLHGDEFGGFSKGDMKVGSIINVRLYRLELGSDDMMADPEVQNKAADRHVLAMAILARSCAINQDFGGLDNHIVKCLDEVFKRDPKTWLRDRFIAHCIFLRGCAKSLFKIRKNAAKEFDCWRKDLNEYQENDDWVVKTHISLVLENIIKGPKDETCEALFRKKVPVLSSRRD